MGSTSSPNCDIVIPIWNQRELTQRCLESVLRSTKESIRFILIDNGSFSPTRDYLDQFKVRSSVPVVLIRNPNNLGFVKAVNQGIRAAQAPWVCLLNNDTLTASGWLEEMIKAAQSDARVGLVNPTSNSLGFHPGDQPLESYAEGLHKKSGQWIELPMAVGFCILARRTLFDQIGLLDESFGMGYFEDEDISRRTQKAGFLCVRSCASYVFHEERASFSKLANRENLFRENRRKFERRWGRSLRILWTVSKPEFFNKNPFDEEIALQCVRQGHWVTFVDPRHILSAELCGYPQMNRLRTDRYGWRLAAMCRLLLRRKKPFDLVVSDDDSLTRWVRRFRWFHRARVFHRPSREEMAAICRQSTDVTVAGGA